MARKTEKKARPAKRRSAAKPKANAKKTVVPKLTPYICVRDAKAAIAFYRKAFGAIEKYRLSEPGGKIGHAEIAIGASVVMMSDEHPDFGALSPTMLGGSPTSFHLKVENADKAVKRALKAGATLVRPVADQFYGERSGMVADPFGYRWFLGADVENVSPKEMQKRYAKAMKA